ncbi:hypothetical protein [Methylophaga sp.]|uniref:hypothetical protein n=1 Tax=Methylophaga sp. TaxID=2024840 RepID=UPI0025E842F5|nr:hypothetical protein [Methylophaga sp.]
MSNEFIETVQESIFNLRKLVGYSVPLQVRISPFDKVLLDNKYNLDESVYSSERNMILGLPLVIDDKMLPNEITVDTMP